MSGLFAGRSILLGNLWLAIGVAERLKRRKSVPIRERHGFAVSISVSWNSIVASLLVDALSS